jgi:hypothetical protein
MTPDPSLPTDPTPEDALSASLHPETTFVGTDQAAATIRRLRDKAYNQRTAFTCAGCNNTWTGNVMAHCATCHVTYGSVASFDRHRRIPREWRNRTPRTHAGCAEPEEIGLYWNPTRNCWSEAYSVTKTR